jgi:hypothetical protein
MIPRSRRRRYGAGAGRVRLEHPQRTLEHWYPDERFCPGVFNTQGLVIRLESTLADDITFSGVAWFQEEG